MSNTKKATVAAVQAEALALRTHNTVTVQPVPPNSYIQNTGANGSPVAINPSPFVLDQPTWDALVAGKTVYARAIISSHRSINGSFYNSTATVYQLSWVNTAFHGGATVLGYVPPANNSPAQTIANLKVLAAKYQENAANSSQGPFGDNGLNSFLNNVIVPVVTTIAIYGATAGIAQGLGGAPAAGADTAAGTTQADLLAANGTAGLSAAPVTASTSSSFADLIASGGQAGTQATLTSGTALGIEGTGVSALQTISNAALTGADLGATALQVAGVNTSLLSTAMPSLFASAPTLNAAGNVPVSTPTNSTTLDQLKQDYAASQKIAGGLKTVQTALGGGPKAATPASTSGTGNTPATPIQSSQSSQNGVLLVAILGALSQIL